VAKKFKSAEKTSITNKNRVNYCENHEKTFAKAIFGLSINGIFKSVLAS
jgi:hypothetical protein